MSNWTGGNVRLDPRIRAEVNALIKATNRTQVDQEVRRLFIKRDGICTLKQAIRHVDRVLGPDTNLFRPATVSVFEALVGLRANAEFHEQAAEAERVEFEAEPIPPSGDQHERSKPGDALIPVRFDGDMLEAVRRQGTAYVAVKRVCEALGVAEQSQAVKLKDCPWATTTMIVAVGSDGKNREILCIDLRSLPMWLAGIHASKVDEAIRPKLLVYQLECRDALARHFGLDDGARQAPQFDMKAMAELLIPVVTAGVAAALKQQQPEKPGKRQRAQYNSAQEPLPYAEVISFDDEQLCVKIKDVVTRKAMADHPGLNGDALGVIIQQNWRQIYTRLHELTGIQADVQSSLAGEKSTIVWCKKRGLMKTIWKICHELWGIKSKSN